MADDMTALTTIERRPVQSPDDLVEVFAKAAVRAFYPEVDENGNPSITRFFLDHGRLPFIDDPVKPWAYPGWLIPQLMLAEAHPEVAPRYHYVCRTLEAGKLLDEPLPKIQFIGESEPSAKPGLKMLADMVRITAHHSSDWDGFRHVCDWLGFALAVTHERPRIDDDIQERLYRFFNLEPWLLNPTDYLGQHLAEMRYNQAGGFFPTPMHICTFMTQAVFEEKEGSDQRSLTVMDPCVGTGRFLLTASNYSMRLSGMDINGLVVLVSKINLSLYAPWFHIPESFFPEKPIKITDENPSTATPPVYTTNIDQPSLFDLGETR